MRKTRVGLVAGVFMSGLLAAACGGGDDAADNGVTSLGDDVTSTTTAGTEPSGEEQLLDYDECLRGEGLDVPDPQVDQNGNLVLPIGPGQQGAVDANDLEEASDVCGEVPRDAVPGMEHEDDSDFEDALLEFAECMRGEGIDLPDPDTSAGPGTGGGPFGEELDMDDPDVAAAYERCRPILADAGFGG
jgi:hypothetical protein